MTYPNLIPVLPEIFMAIMILVLLMVDAFTRESQKGLNLAITLITLVGCFVLQRYVDHGVTQLTFNNMFILDNLATGTKLFTYLFSFVTVLYIKRYVSDKKFQTGEFYAIFLFSVLGMMVMISADNMLVLYVGLELFSLAL
jgi:NADH-quinone oxidoreductase subunit N